MFGTMQEIRFIKVKLSDTFNFDFELIGTHITQKLVSITL